MLGRWDHRARRLRGGQATHDGRRDDGGGGGAVPRILLRATLRLLRRDERRHCWQQQLQRLREELDRRRLPFHPR